MRTCGGTVIVIVWELAPNALALAVKMPEGELLPPTEIVHGSLFPLKLVGAVNERVALLLLFGFDDRAFVICSSEAIVEGVVETLTATPVSPLERESVEGDSVTCMPFTKAVAGALVGEFWPLPGMNPIPL